MKNKYVYLALIFLFLIGLLTVTNSYSLFETNATGDGEMDIGHWQIILNDVDVTYAETLTLDSFTYSTTSHT